MKNIIHSMILWLLTGTILIGQNKPIVLDADTSNEVDDLYALARALIEPSWDILALNACHWQTSHWAVENTMEESHRLNQVILGYLKSDVKARRGAPARMYDWGDLAQHSAGAYEIIKHALQITDGQKLTVIALGALTNVSSALYIEPQIAEKIAVYWLGTTYDFEKEILRRNDFNVMMDQRAFDYIMHSDVELHVIPTNVAAAMTFDFEEVEKKLRGLHPMMDYFVDRWYQHLDGSRYQRTIWDLGLIGAIIHPEWAEEVEIMTSKDLASRKVYYFREINGEKIRQEFFEKMTHYFAD